MRGLARAAREQARSGRLSVDKGGEGVTQGGELAGEHRELAMQCVDEDPCDGAALGDGVALAPRERQLRAAALADQRASTWTAFSYAAVQIGQPPSCPAQTG
jgi:hypothetical protein